MGHKFRDEGRGDGLRVAIIDDEYYALEGLRIKLSELDGIEVVGMYEDSELFLEVLDEARPDIVLLDIEMPKLNGLQVQEKMKGLGNQAKVVFVTAYSDYGEQIATTDALDYIVKPVSRERLEEALNKVPSVL